MENGETPIGGAAVKAAPIENKSAADAKDNLEALSSGLKGAFAEKEEEYARRIVAGENSATMGVSPQLQEGVRKAVERLQQKKVQAPQASKIEPGVISTIDFGTTEEELEEQKKAARAAMPENTPATIDFGTTEEELEQEKTKARAAMPENTTPKSQT